MNEIFEKVYHQENLSREEMGEIANEIFDGELTDAQISSFLTGMKIKGETPEEMAGLAETIQKKAVHIVEAPAHAMDNCGTGGDQCNSFNISTTSAFVLAAGGVPMAKHGNRSVSSRSGSADVLEVLGIQLAISPEKISYLLKEIGIAFLFAPRMHPKMGYVLKVRKELATPTILNLIGPLTNPVQLETQLLGTYRKDLVGATAETLRQLGRKQGIVVHGAGGMDEANLSGINYCALMKDKKVTEFEFDPLDYGFSRQPIAAIKGSTPEVNAGILQSVLKNESSVYLDTVLLNAGLGFFASGQVDNLKAGIDRAKDCISSGAAYTKMLALINAQKEAA